MVARVLRGAVYETEQVPNAEMIGLQELSASLNICRFHLIHG